MLAEARLGAGTQAFDVSVMTKDNCSGEKEPHANDRWRLIEEPEHQRGGSRHDHGAQRDDPTRENN